MRPRAERIRDSPYWRKQLMQHIMLIGQNLSKQFIILLLANMNERNLTSSSKKPRRLNLFISWIMRGTTQLMQRCAGKQFHCCMYPWKHRCRGQEWGHKVEWVYRKWNICVSRVAPYRLAIAISTEAYVALRKNQDTLRYIRLSMHVCPWYIISARVWLEFILSFREFDPWFISIISTGMSLLSFFVFPLSLSFSLSLSLSLQITYIPRCSLIDSVHWFCS